MLLHVIILGTVYILERFTADSVEMISERDTKLQGMNASLRTDKLEELQERLDKLDNTSDMNPQSCFSQRISEMQSQLAASEDELKTEVGEKNVDTESSQGTNMK